MKITHTENYAELRKKDYPPMTELADALYWQSQGNNAPMEAYLAKCEAVKQRYPKLPGKL